VEVVETYRAHVVEFFYEHVGPAKAFTPGQDSGGTIEAWSLPVPSHPLDKSRGRTKIGFSDGNATGKDNPFRVFDWLNENHCVLRQLAMVVPGSARSGCVLLIL
jgi:hypothetical protein